MHWDRGAACKKSGDPDVFFPVGEAGLVRLLTAEAKSYCQRCPVRGECLAGALERREAHGVWGGLDEDERRALLRRAAGRGAAAAERTEEAVDASAPTS
ncbi:WhiB family transcriptional regulator [Streptomyces sp. MCAF7]